VVKFKSHFQGLTFPALALGRCHPTAQMFGLLLLEPVVVVVAVVFTASMWAVAVAVVPQDWLLHPTS
jgi:hypothetical protein